jgi:penicillin amidase
MKIFKRVIFALLIIIILALVIAYFYLKATAPQYEGSLKIKGLHEKVDVIFDEYGIPHIYAQNEHDAYLALGYVHAHDRIFQMEMLRRVTNGRLSEILGESMVNVDKTLITLGIDAMGKRCEKEFFEGKTGDYQDATMAYLKGLNGFIDAGKLPVEFIMLGIKPKHFSPADVYATIGYMAFGFTAALKEEPFASEIFNKLGNDYLLDFELDSLSNMQLQHKDSISELYYHSIWMARDEVEYKLPIPYWHGSNNWAISSEKSKSGKVLLGNDTHIKYGQPAVWFEAYIEYPGHQMYGYFLAGVPFPIIGHNQDYGWG